MTAKELQLEIERLKGVIAAGRELQAELVDALEGTARDYAKLMMLCVQSLCVQSIGVKELLAHEIEVPQLTWRTKDGAPIVDLPLLRKHGRL